MIEAQYNQIEKEYSNLVEVDPSKKYVQYPSALRLLGEVKGKNILDIGCGEGIFDRQLAHVGAQVTAYDVSDKQVDRARETEQAEKLGIDFKIADPKTFKADNKFDEAVSVMVLLYAKNKEELREFFLSAAENLKDGAKFVSITFNPDFKRKGEIVYNRRFSKTEDGGMKVEFFDNEKKSTFSALFSDFSIEDYEKAAENTGFKKLHWESLKIDDVGKKEKGIDFWVGYEEDCPYVGLVLEK
jgi:cyclopropane fatty-acyl-phospholipid synthase-like methyltransferase